MLRIAVTGAGRISKIHVTTVATHPQARLVLICGPFTEAMKTLAEPFGACTSADVAGAFSTDDVDAVVTGSPTPLHTEHVLAAARVGKAALCGKPVVSSVEAVRVLADEPVTFGHPPVMVGF